MRLRVEPGSSLTGETSVPGDKSIAHRWLILSSTAKGGSTIHGLPSSLDVRSMASCLAAVAPESRPGLETWSRKDGPGAEPGGSTWNALSGTSALSRLEVQSEGRPGLVEPAHDLDCGNSGTAMRLLTGLLAGVPVPAVLVGDDSLSGRPMERVAAPLREMGARVTTSGGHAPITVRGGSLHGITYRTPVPSAQVKSAVLFAGLAAEGITTVEEMIPTRDHTERALRALGGPVSFDGTTVRLEAFQHEGFEGTVPGDPSSAAFIVAAAALTGSEVTLRGVGLNPSRLHFLDIMSRMGVQTEARIDHDMLGEPVGDLWVAQTGAIRATTIQEDEIALVIDEIPVLAALAAHAPQDTWFLGASELRVKESDRLTGLAEGLRSLGGNASVEGEDLVVAGGGLAGGSARGGGDHRMAMAFAVTGLAADGVCEIDGVEAADVSFPGFVTSLSALGARFEVSS